MSEVKPIPDGFHTVTSYFGVHDAPQAIEFYTKAFGAEEIFRLTEPSGKIGHAELRIGSSMVMLADEYPDFGSLSPSSLGGSPVTFQLSVEDPEAFLERATGAGATLLRPLKLEFHGHLQAMVADPFGYKWFISTRVDEVSPEEMQRRFSESFT